MSSSDEETLSERSCRSERSYRSERSGSLSPCPPGDTLPWNLPLHEQKKRKSQDSVLDPAERAVVRVAGKKTCPRWNKNGFTITAGGWGYLEDPPFPPLPAFLALVAGNPFFLKVLSDYSGCKLSLPLSACLDERASSGVSDLEVFSLK
uniref:Microtubule-actin cross-linking factor 1 n=1 Tax=Sphenodon punctatus TaxID=8508 RepID=A0A8D0L0X0_SPHPU